MKIFLLIGFCILFFFNLSASEEIEEGDLISSIGTCDDDDCKAYSEKTNLIKYKNKLYVCNYKKKNNNYIKQNCISCSDNPEAHDCNNLEKVERNIITNKEVLKGIEKEIKYVGNTDKNWISNRNNEDLWEENNIEFDVSFIDIIMENTPEGIIIDGTVYLQNLDYSGYGLWGKAILNVRRIKDNKSFKLYVDRLSVLDRNKLYKMYNEQNFDWQDYEKFKVVLNDFLKSKKEPIKIPSVINLKDIDQDGNQELVYFKQTCGHSNRYYSGESLVFNLHNTEDRFELKEKPNTIMLKYPGTEIEYYSSSEWVEHIEVDKDKNNITVVDDTGCCFPSLSNLYCSNKKYFWEKIGQNFKLKQIIETDFFYNE